MQRKLLHVNVTRNPIDKWTALQLGIAMQNETEIKYLILVNDSIFAQQVKEKVNDFSIKHIRTGIQAPWQNGYCERLVGLIKQECTNHIIALGNKHLRNILTEYKNYYNNIRCHGSIDGDAPNIRESDPPENGANIISIPVLGGLHHQYKRAA